MSILDTTIDTSFNKVRERAFNEELGLHTWGVQITDRLVRINADEHVRYIPPHPDFVKDLDFVCVDVEDITTFPSINIKFADSCRRGTVIKYWDFPQKGCVTTNSSMYGVYLNFTGQGCVRTYKSCSANIQAEHRLLFNTPTLAYLKKARIRTRTVDIMPDPFSSDPIQEVDELLAADMSKFRLGDYLQHISAKKVGIYLQWHCTVEMFFVKWDHLVPDRVGTVKTADGWIVFVGDEGANHYYNPMDGNWAYLIGQNFRD